MGEFEEYIKGKYPTDYEHLKCRYPNVPVVEFYGDEQDVWNHQQSKIEQLEKINAKNQNTLQHFECEYLRVIAENKALRGECE